MCCRITKVRGQARPSGLKTQKPPPPASDSSLELLCRMQHGGGGGGGGGGGFGCQGSASAEPALGWPLEYSPACEVTINLYRVPQAACCASLMQLPTQRTQTRAVEKQNA